MFVPVNISVCLIYDVTLYKNQAAESDKNDDKQKYTKYKIDDFTLNFTEENIACASEPLTYDCNREFQVLFYFIYK